MTIGDVELWSLDPARNRFRANARSEGRTRFGKVFLRVAPARLRSTLRERIETLGARNALDRRRAELVELRRRHGYFVPWVLGARRRMLLDQGLLQSTRVRLRVRPPVVGQTGLSFESVS